MEKLIAERARLHVGDTMRFDVLGRIVAARVTQHSRRGMARVAQRRVRVRVSSRACSIRRRRRFVTPLKGPEGLSARARFQHDLVERFPNVSIIDFHEVLETVRDVMSKVTLAITVVGGLVLFSGGLILIGAVAMTKFQRVYEAAVFKTLGANTRTIARMLLFEYGVLGSLAGLIGSLGAIVLTWGVSRYALEIPWRVFAGEHIGGCPGDGAARGRHRRGLEPRCPEEQAARDAPRGIAPAFTIGSDPASRAQFTSNLDAETHRVGRSRGCVARRKATPWLPPGRAARCDLR